LTGGFFVDVKYEVKGLNATGAEWVAKALIGYLATL
jgi:hypothetical protein